MHMATQIMPDVPILFLETGYQFAETLAFKEQLTDRLGLNVVDLYGEYTVERQAEEFGPRLYERDPERCCDLNKVQPMFEALRELDAWVTAFRRDSSPTRANAPFVEQYELEPGSLDREGEPDGAWTPRAGVGLPQGARPAAQPALRPGLQPRSAARRARGCGSPASPSAPDAGRACRSGSAGSTDDGRLVDRPSQVRSGDDPERLARELDLEARGDRPASRRPPARGTARRR